MNKNSLILVTGGAGFIGANMCRHLNEAGYENLLIVDDLTYGDKFKNLKGLKFDRYIDKEYLFNFLKSAEIDCIIHLGANSSTTQTDGKKCLDDNYELSSNLLWNYLLKCEHNKKKAKFIYASSASVYGNEKDGKIDPLNVYAFSKYLFDKDVCKYYDANDDFMGKFDDKNREFVTGLRFYNVYGQNEGHKEDQSSPIHKFYKQAKSGAGINCFEVDAKRDFIHVDDVCKVMMFFMNNDVSGIFDVGTGVARDFRDVRDIIREYVPEVRSAYSPDHSCDEDVPFPKHLDGHYQYFTQANLAPLRDAGYTDDFMTLEQGIKKFVG